VDADAIGDYLHFPIAHARARLLALLCKREGAGNEKVNEFAVADRVQVVGLRKLFPQSAVAFSVRA